MHALWKGLTWLVTRLSVALLAAGLVLGIGGLWYFFGDEVDFQEWREELIGTLSGDKAQTVAALSDVRERLNATQEVIDLEEKRISQADRVIRQLEDLESLWDKLVGNPEQQKANAEQMQRMQELRQVSQNRLELLRQEYRRTTWERDGLEIALGRLNEQIEAVERDRSEVMHYTQQAWDRWGHWLVSAIVLYFLGPPALRLALFFGIAPLVSRGRPVRLRESLPALPEVTSSQVTADLSLRPGERIWTKEVFLQASDEHLARRTRLLLDWRMPFTCLAGGLLELIELKAEAEGNPNGGRVTLSHHDHPQTELAVVSIPEDSALVLRPGFLAAAILPNDRRLKIRRRWQLFRWQAWMTLQFRYFEFQGPARLVVAGSRGVRIERLSGSTEGWTPARRTNQGATIGFTPNLDYRPIRAETFWSYFRGMNPLFDDHFSGTGIFLCQQIAGASHLPQAESFWSNVWNGLRRIFGM